MPVPPVVDLPVEMAVPLESQLPIGSSQLSTSINLDGAVESFDPVVRATDLVSTLPRQWCGTYRSLPDGADQTVLLTLADVRSYGQMVALRGEIAVGSVKSPVQGNLNAKSDQLDLIPLAEPLGEGLELGDAFLGLQGFGVAGLQAARLTNPGGRLNLSSSCGSEALPIRGLW